jgi:hypothetical protein
VIAIVDSKRSNRIDMTRRYSLMSGARLIPRAPDTVQIGTDPPRCMLVVHAPRESLRILGSLDGATPVGQVLTTHDADPLLWTALLEQLMAADLLYPVDQTERDSIPSVFGAHLSAERSGLAHQHGHIAADRIMQARGDALVVVRGRPWLATSILSMLAAAGIGHLHHETGPFRALSPRSTTSGRNPGGAGGMGSLGASLRETFPTVRVHPPAAHQHPTIVVLAEGDVPDLGLAATYTKRRIPHLAVTAGTARAVVGPLVLPGRSSCLSCAHRHRTDIDPEWPVVARHLAHGTSRAPVFLATAAACLTVGQVLDYIDGVVMPSTVNGTLEWRSGDLAPRRRTWEDHPECGCRGQV